MRKIILCYLMMLSIIFSTFMFPITVHASPAEVLTEAELLRQSFQVLEGGAVDSGFTGFKVIEGGLSVAEKEAMVSSFGSQILAGAKSLGYKIGVAGAVAVTEYTALEVGYRALDAIMDSSAGDEITKLWVNTFRVCAYNGTSSLATEKVVLKSNMLSGLENLLNKRFNGDFELNSGIVGNGVALGSDYFQNATSTGVEAYKALNSSNQATLVFNGDTSIRYMSHYFVNGASYGVISNGLLTLYTASGEPCTMTNSSGKCTTSYILGTTFYGLSVYSSMTSFAINLGNTFQMVSGSGIKLYEDSLDNPLTTTVPSPISVPDTAISLPNSITVPMSVDDALSIANGETEAEIDDSKDTNIGTSSSILDWLKNAWKIFTDILDAIAVIPSAIGKFFGQVLKVSVQGDVSLSQATVDAFETMINDIVSGLFVPEQGITEEWVQTELDYINAQTGVLTYPLGVLIKFLDRILDVNVGDMVLTLPRTTWHGREVIPEKTFNMTQFLKDNPTLNTFYGYYLIVIKAILVFGVVNLAKRKFEEMMRN